MIPGIDVGRNQGNVSLSDCRALKQAGKRFGIVRCVEGLGGIDPRFAPNVAGFQAVGIPIGPYFPPHPDLDPVKQAQDHFDACKGLGSHPGELAPWCDIELTRGRTPEEVLEFTIAYCNAASLLWGRRITVYTYPDFDHAELAAGMTDGATLAGTSLAMAAYRAAPPTAPAPWTAASMLFWQNSGGVAVPGVPVYRVPNGCPCDTDFFLGDEAAFADALDPSKG